MDKIEGKVAALRVGLGVGVLAFIALLAPLMWAAASAALGLLTVGVVGLVGIGLMQALPLLGQKWENKLLSLRKAEARANPIEQLQQFFLDKHARVEAFRKAVVQIGTQIRSLNDMLVARVAKKPNADVSKQRAALTAMTQAHLTLVDKHERATQALVQLEEVIEDKKFEWQFGQAGQSALSQLNAASGEDIVNQMLADEAFASVRDNFNQVFSELEMEAVRLTNQKSLAFEGGLTLDLSAINLTESVPVAR